MITEQIPVLEGQSDVLVELAGPKRIQRRRVKGWKMPENTVYVGRGSKWGNPYRVMQDGGFMWVEPEGKALTCSTDRMENRIEKQTEAVELFRERWVPLHTEAIRTELAGKNLACWCPHDLPCHADVLLELANHEATQ